MRSAHRPRLVQSRRERAIFHRKWSTAQLELGRRFGHSRRADDGM